MLNKPVLFLILCVALATATSTFDLTKFERTQITEEDFEQLFGLYRIHKAPFHIEPSVERYNYFKSRVQSIINHNKNPNKTWKRTITKFTGLTVDELKGVTLMESQNCSATHFPSEPASQGFTVFPDYFDWRQAGVVSKVKDQGNCGSCWTFSTTGAVESHWALFKATKPPLLSEQQLVDCAGDFNNFGCNGGLPSQAFQYIQANGGLESEDSYPYKGVDQQCSFDSSKIVASVQYGSYNVTSGDEQGLQESLFTHGPVSIAFEVTDDFMDYDSGVYVGKTCHQDSAHVNHAVLAVGFGHDKTANLDYWIVKNSWSTTWGENGYFRIQRGVNMCGVAVCASYPQMRPPKF